MGSNGKAYALVRQPAALVKDNKVLTFVSSQNTKGGAVLCAASRLGDDLRGLEAGRTVKAETSWSVDVKFLYGHACDIGRNHQIEICSAVILEDGNRRFRDTRRRG